MEASFSTGMKNRHDLVLHQKAKDIFLILRKKVNL